MVGRLKPGRSKSSARHKLYLANDVRDHTDFSRARGAAIDHLFANDHRSCIVLGAGRDVLGGQRSQGADRAERDNEKAEGRLQHVRSPVRRWCGVVDDGYRG